MAKSSKTLTEEAVEMSERAGRLKRRARTEGSEVTALVFQQVERLLEDALGAAVQAVDESQEIKTLS